MAHEFRCGVGYDLHRLEKGRKLILGGVEIPFEKGLAGHSDADILMHALTDALLGAAGLGDIGHHFPDTDPRWKGADSLLILARVAELVREAGWRIENVDIKVVCERPKLAPRIDEMQRNLSTAAGAPITVAGRRAEGLGALGRQEGIAAWSVALITSDDAANPTSAEETT